MPRKSEFFRTVSPLAFSFAAARVQPTQFQAVATPDPAAPDSFFSYGAVRPVTISSLASLPRSSSFEFRCSCSPSSR
jgi:hypothetical protein